MPSNDFYKKVIFCYSIGDTELQKCTKFRDLIVAFDSKLSFNNILNTINKFMFCHEIFQNFSKCHSFVRSKLKYAGVA